MSHPEQTKIQPGGAACQAASPCKKLMVLGGSNCQLHALQRAKERGLKTLLVDYTSNPPGKEFTDTHLQVSTFDVDACIRVAKEESVDAVLCVGTDQPVLTAAKIASALHLPSPLSVDEAYAVTNKCRMKQIFRNAGIKTPAFGYLTKDRVFLNADGEKASFTLRFPCVIKPLDSQGQRGVFKVLSRDELFLRLPDTLSFSREDICLVEEYYDGDEITVSGWLKNGELFPLSVTDRIHYPDPVHIGVCTGHRYPTIHIRHYDEIISLCKHTADAFGIGNGPFYFQLLYGADGPVAGELACRVGGAFEDVTINRLFAFPILDAAIDLSLGKTVPDPPVLSRRILQEKRAFVLLLFCRPGVITGISQKQELLSLPFVADCGYNYNVGDEIPVMQNATARFGHAVLFGDSDSIGANVRSFLDTLHVTGPDGCDLLLRSVVENRYLEE